MNRDLMKGKEFIMWYLGDSEQGKSKWKGRCLSRLRNSKRSSTQEHRELGAVGRCGQHGSQGHSGFDAEWDGELLRVLNQGRLATTWVSLTGSLWLVCAQTVVRQV